MNTKKEHIASVQPLLDYFNNLLPLDEMESELVASKFHHHLYRKKQYALQHGDVCQYFHFVVRGCLRLYKADHEGGVHFLEFGTANSGIRELANFQPLKPSQLNIGAREDTVGPRLNYCYFSDPELKGQKFN